MLRTELITTRSDHVERRWTVNRSSRAGHDWRQREQQRGDFCHGLGRLGIRKVLQAAEWGAVLRPTKEKKAPNVPASSLFCDPEGCVCMCYDDDDDVLREPVYMYMFSGVLYYWKEGRKKMRLEGE